MSNQLILVLNCGSSSLKFAVLDPKNGDEYISGLAECFHLEDARIKWKLDGQKGEFNLGAGAAHTEALAYLVNHILAAKPELKDAIGAIGHRVVHGGEKYKSSVVIDDGVLKGIEESAVFAPLHNPANLIGIAEAFKAFPHLKAKNVAVFDTAFHATMPEEAFLYAIPKELYEKHGIRRYGFHGTSHDFVSKEAARLLNQPIEETNVITCHLGNGASITAVKNGKSIDTSMGLTPLEGLVMGTRSGDIDPAIMFFLHDNLNLSIEDIDNLLNKKSGFLGLTGVSSDCRYVEEHYATDPAALDVFIHRLVKYIGGYSQLMDGRLDAIVFTGGIGENSELVRRLVMQRLSLLGFELDQEKNLAARFGKGGFISKDNTRKAIVIPTNEELVIARDTARLAL